MLGVKSYRLTLAMGFCVVFPLLNGCQEPNGQSESSAPIANMVASSAAVSSGSAPIGLTTYQPPQTTSLLANCNTETVDGKAFGATTPTVQSGSGSSFKGWLDASGVASPVYRMRFDDAAAGRYLQAPLSLTVQRSDVAAAHLGVPLVSGFDLKLSPGVLSAGTYHVYLAVESGGKTYVCDSGRHIKVIH